MLLKDQVAIITGGAGLNGLGFDDIPHLGGRGMGTDVLDRLWIDGRIRQGNRFFRKFEGNAAGMNDQQADRLGSIHITQTFGDACVLQPVKASSGDNFRDHQFAGLCTHGVGCQNLEIGFLAAIRRMKAATFSLGRLSLKRRLCDA